MKSRTMVILAGLIVGTLCISAWAYVSYGATSTQDEVGKYLFNGRYYLTPPTIVNPYIQDAEWATPSVYQNRLAVSMNSQHIYIFNRSTNSYRIVDGLTQGGLASVVCPCVHENYCAFLENTHFNMLGDDYFDMNNLATNVTTVELHWQNFLAGWNTPDMSSNLTVVTTGSFSGDIIFYDSQNDTSWGLGILQTINGVHYELGMDASLWGRKLATVLTDLDTNGTYLYVVGVYDIDAHTWQVFNDTLMNNVFLTDYRNNNIAFTYANGSDVGWMIMRDTGSIIFNNKVNTTLNQDAVPIYYYDELMLSLESGNLDNGYNMSLTDIQTGQMENLTWYGAFGLKMGRGGFGQNLYEFGNGTYELALIDQNTGNVTLQYLIPTSSTNEVAHHVQHENSMLEAEAQAKIRDDVLLLTGSLVLLGTVMYAIWTKDRTQYYER